MEGSGDEWLLRALSWSDHRQVAALQLQTLHQIHQGFLHGPLATRQGTYPVKILVCTTQLSTQLISRTSCFHTGHVVSWKAFD